MSNNKVVVVALGVFVVAFAAGWIYAGGQSTAPVAQKVPLTLPETTERITPCFPGYAAHWTAANAISNVEGATQGAAGPTFLVNDDTGEVIGIEYHFVLDALQDFSNKNMYVISPYGDPTNPEVNTEIDTKVNRFGVPRNLMGANYEYFDMKWSVGHSGLEFGHMDVHLYTIKPEQRVGVCGGIEGIPETYRVNEA